MERTLGDCDEGPVGHKAALQVGNFMREDDNVEGGILLSFLLPKYAVPSFLCSSCYISSERLTMTTEI